MGKKISGNVKWVRIIASIIAVQSSTFGQDNLIELNRVAAKVNDDIVTWGEIQRAMEQLNFTNNEKKARASEFVDGKVDRLLAIYAFKEKGMAIPDSYIDQEFNKRMIKDYNGDRRLFRNYLRSRGQTENEFRDDIREEIIYQHMLSTRRRLKEDISPARVEEYYKKNSFKFKTSAKVRIREIVLKPIADEPLTVLFQQAKKISEEIKDGKKFEEIARSTGQSVYREKGGDWGVLISEREIRSDEIRKQAFSLKEGQFSEPFKVDLLERMRDGSVVKSGKSAVYLIQIAERESSGLQPLENLRSEIETMISREVESEAQRKWLTNVKEDAYVRINLP